MKFDYTKGNTARWMVSIYRDTVDDQYYFHFFSEAKKFFDKVVLTEKNAILSLYDMGKDVRKEFVRV